jgi:hypothetical protein
MDNIEGPAPPVNYSALQQQPDQRESSLPAEVSSSRTVTSQIFWWALVPNISTLAFIVMLLYGFFFWSLGFLYDLDTGLHIQTGKNILATFRVPHTDPYSFSCPNCPWFAWEWLTDAVMGAVHQVAGLNGVVLLYSLAIALCVWLWFRLNWAVGGNLALACVLACPLFYALRTHLLARPHIFSWLFLLWIVLFFDGLKGPLSRRQATLIFGGMVLWANLHASFFLGPFIGLIYTAARFCAPLIWEDAADANTGATAKATLIALVATLINPYGWNVHKHAFRFLHDTALIDSIVEYQSYNFHGKSSWVIMIALFISAGGAILAFNGKQLARCILPSLFFAGALHAGRMIPLLALVGLPLANGAITTALRSLPEFRPAIRRIAGEIAHYTDSLRMMESRANGWLTAVLVVIACTLAIRSSSNAAQTVILSRYPIQTVETIAWLPIETRLFAPDRFGGYLVYRFGGQRKIFFDGRGDFYGAEFINRYRHIVSLKPSWPEMWDNYHFTHALIPNDYRLIEALEQRGWKRLDRDFVATLLAAPDSK